MTGESAILVRRMYEAVWNEGKLEVIDEICAPDYIGVGRMATNMARSPSKAESSTVAAHFQTSM